MRSSLATRIITSGLVAALIGTAAACSSSTEEAVSGADATDSTTSQETTAGPEVTIDDTADPFPPAELIGEWLTVYDYAQTFFDDGTWTISSPDKPDELYDAGAWEVRAATLIIVSDLEDSPAPCDPGDVGYFELSHAEDGGLALGLLDDDCRGRGGALRQGLTPVR